MKEVRGSRGHAHLALPEAPKAPPKAPLGQRRDARSIHEASSTVKSSSKPSAMEVPKVSAKSAFHDVAKSLLSERLSSNHLLNLKKDLEVANQNRGWISRIIDFFGSKEGRALDALRSHLNERLEQAAAHEEQQEIAAEKQKSESAKAVVKDLLAKFNGSPDEAVQELLERAKVANKNFNVSGFELSLRALSEMSKSPDNLMSAAAIEALKQVQKLQSLDVSTARRTPSEILVNFASDLEKSGSSITVPSQKAILEEVRQEVKSAFISHQMNVEQARELLEKASQKLQAAGLYEIAGRNLEFAKQLPSSPDDIASTRYHDNIYGRVYDSKLIAHLVENPPQGVIDSMEKSGKFLADWISDPRKIDPSDLDLVAKKIQHYLKEADPRFWFGKAPGLERVRDAATPEDAKVALLDFLRSPKQSGEEAIAIPYLNVKLSIILRDLSTARAKADAAKSGMQPNTTSYTEYVRQNTYNYTPWMNKADVNYSLVGTQSNLDVGRKPEANVATSGITMQHQPAAVSEEGINYSLRPATRNRPRLGDEMSSATRVALSQGIPFVSGASGSTNINLHLLDYMARNLPKREVPDPKNFLLGNTMFLVHDGGHSIHEALWVANQTQPKIGLGLGLGDASRPNQFVSDVRQLIGSHEGESQQKVQSASDRAWTETMNYFNTHSAFRNKPTDS